MSLNLQPPSKVAEVINLGLGSPSAVSFDLAALRQERNAVLSRLLDDPRTFARTLYTKQKQGIFRKTVEIFSPYFNLDDPRFCCLTQEIGPDSDATLPKTCYFSTIVSLDKTDKLQVKLMAVNQSFFIKISPVSDLHMTYSDEAPTKIKASKQDVLTMCNYKALDQVKYLGSDKFTNSVLIGFLLNIVYEKANNGLTGILQTYGATVCQEGVPNRKGVLFLEYVDGHSFHAFTEKNAIAPHTMSNAVTGQRENMFVFSKDYVVGIFKQLVANLHFMWHNMYFNHGGLVVSSLSVAGKVPNKVSYQGMNIDSSFTIKISDFDYSSMTIANAQSQYIRLYNRNAITEKFLSFSGFDPIVNSTSGQAYYKLNANFNTTTLARVRHMGIPYYSSFDLYTVLVSLLMIPQIFYTVFDDIQLKTLFFDTMWFPEDVSSVYTQISRAVEKNSGDGYEEVIRILRNRKLKCNLLDDMVRNLSRL